MNSLHNYVLSSQYVAPIVFEENFSLYDEQASQGDSSNVDFNRQESNPPISWISDTNNQAEYVKRWSINNLVQFETCKQINGLSIDQPSLLVKVECRKQGCRCVLKNEPALAMKIVPGVNLIQGTTTASVNKSSSSIHEDFHSTPKMSHNKNSWFDMRSSSQMSISSCTSERQSSKKEPSSSASANKTSSFVITSCCPAWFELVNKTPNGPADVTSHIGPPLPIWTSGKALWKAKASLVLLRKGTKYFTSYPSSFLETIPNINHSQLHSQQMIAIDSENPATLKPGTVIVVIAMKSCQFLTITSSSNGSIRAKSKTKSTNMLQCGILGYKTLSKIPGYFDKPLPKEMPYIYLPLDDPNVVFSPVAVPPILSGQVRNSPSVNNWSGGGVHSILSLLSLYRMPLYVKPIFGKNLFDWLSNANATDEMPRKKITHFDSLIKFNSCYYGTLIFLEPLFAPENSLPNNLNGQNPAQQSRFFVVTSKMLSQHTFLVADSQSRKNYQFNLSMHANRVAQFLSACHPVYGLNYLFKYLEDNTNFSNIGPPNEPLTKSLGPPIHYQTTLSSIYSIAAMTSILRGNLDIEPDSTESAKSSDGSNVSSGFGSIPGMNSSESGSNLDILNEIEEIYLYVRTGRLPENAKGIFKKMRSHSMVNQNKVFVVQNPMPEMTSSQDCYSTMHNRQHSTETSKTALPEMINQMIISDNFFKSFPKISLSKSNSSNSAQKVSSCLPNVKNQSPLFTDSGQYTRSSSHSQPKSPLVRFSYKNASFSQPSNSPYIRPSFQSNQKIYQEVHNNNPVNHLTPSQQQQQQMIYVQSPIWYQTDQVNTQSFDQNNLNMMPVNIMIENQAFSPTKKSSDRNIDPAMASSLCSLPEFPKITSPNQPLCAINEFGEVTVSYIQNSPNVNKSSNDNSRVWMRRNNSSRDFVDNQRACCLSNLSLVGNQNSYSNSNPYQMNSPLIYPHTNNVMSSINLNMNRPNDSPDTGLGGDPYFAQISQHTTNPNNHVWTSNCIVRS